MPVKRTGGKLFLQHAFAGIFALTLLMPFYAILERSDGDIKRFIQAKGDYARLRDSYPAFAATTEAKKTIPPLSPVGITYSPSGIENVAARYSLYPFKLSENPAYLIDLARSVKNPILFPQRKKLSNGVFIYAKESSPFLPGKETSAGLSLPGKLLIFFSFALFQTVLGMLVLRLLGIGPGATGYLWSAATGYLVGFCLFTASLWIILLLGFALEIRTLLILGAFLFVPLLFFSLGHNLSVNRTSLSKEVKSPLAKMLFALTVCLAGIITLWIISNPVKDWDTMANWAIKSKVIFHEKSLNLQYTQENRNSYPILWPLHIAAQFTLLRGDHDEVALWNSALFFLILLSQLLKGFSFMGAKPLFANICILAYMAYFTSQNPTTSALPENAFLCLLAGLLISACLWLKSPEKRQYLILSVILAAGLNLIKLEGAAATLIIVFSLAVTKKKDALGAPARPFLLALLLTTLLPALWIYWIRLQGFSSGIAHLQGGFSFRKLILLMGLNILQFVEYREYLILFFGCAYFVFFPNPRGWNASEKFLLSVSILLMIFKWLATLGWPEEWMLASGIFNEASWRLFLHTGPGLALLFGSRMSRQDQA